MFVRKDVCAWRCQLDVCLAVSVGCVCLAVSVAYMCLAVSVGYVCLAASVRRRVGLLAQGCRDSKAGKRRDSKDTFATTSATSPQCRVKEREEAGQVVNTYTNTHAKSNLP